ncbi:hypothetical protein NP493_1279g00001 [Ridgeia piscesae]|uniref:Alpha-L-arabinofuranosidase B arabinose-binding domain-containing protein n=1 Tax=Ridgeia piscesae TaxID=27915 RepID=A0AAD9K9Z7_RIDPI|nr:hypothetical protein NP493_1279g00001 [Ridgeia piscesae]
MTQTWLPLVCLIVAIAVGPTHAGLAGPPVHLRAYDWSVYMKLQRTAGNAAVMGVDPTAFRLVRPGLTGASNTVSIAVDGPTRLYLRHYNSRLYLEPKYVPIHSPSTMYEDATFVEHENTFFKFCTAFESVNNRGYYISFDANRDVVLLPYVNQYTYEVKACFFKSKFDVQIYILLFIHILLVNVTTYGSILYVHALRLEFWCVVDLLVLLLYILLLMGSITYRASSQWVSLKTKFCLKMSCFKTHNKVCFI